MKSQMLAVFFLLLCAQFLYNFALESKEEKLDAANLNENGYSGGRNVNQDEIVLSKASKAKGSGGQVDHPKKSKAMSMFIKPAATYRYTSGIDIGGIIAVCMILVFEF